MILRNFPIAHRIKIKIRNLAFRVFTWLFFVSCFPVLVSNYKCSLFQPYDFLSSQFYSHYWFVCNGLHTYNRHLIKNQFLVLPVFLDIVSVCLCFSLPFCPLNIYRNVISLPCYNIFWTSLITLIECYIPSEALLQDVEFGVQGKHLYFQDPRRPNNMFTK